MRREPYFSNISYAKTAAYAQHLRDGIAFSGLRGVRVSRLKVSKEADDKGSARGAAVLLV